MNTNLAYTISQLINFGVLTCFLMWPILSIIAIFSLKNRLLTPTVKAIWTAIVLAIPVLGALAYFIIAPGRDEAV